jgi:hypothetical protein
MGALSESNFGLGISEIKSLNFGRLETVEFRPETLEFRSDISNLGTFLEHFWQSWNFGPFGVSSSSQQRIWYKFESYSYQKTTPDAGDGWARISFPKFQVRRQLFFEILFAFSYVMQTRIQRRLTILFRI